MNSIPCEQTDWKGIPSSEHMYMGHLQAKINKLNVRSKNLGVGKQRGYRGSIYEFCCSLQNRQAINHYLSLLDKFAITAYRDEVRPLVAALAQAAAKEINASSDTERYGRLYKRATKLHRLAHDILEMNEMLEKKVRSIYSSFIFLREKHYVLNKKLEDLPELLKMESARARVDENSV